MICKERDRTHFALELPTPYFFLCIKSITKNNVLVYMTFITYLGFQRQVVFINLHANTPKGFIKKQYNLIPRVLFKLSEIH